MGLVELLICSANLRGTLGQVGRLIVSGKPGAQTLVARSRADSISRTSLHKWGRQHTIYAKRAHGTPRPDGMKTTAWQPTRIMPSSIRKSPGRKRSVRVATILTGCPIFHTGRSYKVESTGREDIHVSGLTLKIAIHPGTETVGPSSVSGQS